jgi:hypothetical protein
MLPVYSAQFINIQGQAGPQTPVTVPTGRVYVVKFLACYVSALRGEVRGLFKDFVTNAGIWHERIDQFETDSRQLVEAQIVFPAGSQFGFSVATTGTDAADVFAAGYDLSA